MEKKGRTREQDFLPSLPTPPTLPPLSSTFPHFPHSLISLSFQAYPNSIALLAAAVIFLSATPGQAQDLVPDPIELPQINLPSISIPSSLVELFEDIKTIVGDIETFLSERGIEISHGEIGLPDLEAARSVFAEDEQLDEFSDLFGTQTGSTFANRDKLLQQYLRDLSQEYAENSVLSQPGQEKIAQKVTSSQETALSSIELSEDSATQDVSQNILRNISRQLSLQQQIDAMHIFELQEAKIARNLQLEMDAELLSELSQSTTRQEREYISTNKTILNGMPYVIMPTEREVR